MWIYAVFVLANRRKRVHMRDNTSSYEIRSGGCLLADLFLYSLWRSKLSCILLSIFFWSFVLAILTQTLVAAETFSRSLSLFLFPVISLFSFSVFFSGLLLLLLLMSYWLATHVPHVVIGDEGLAMFIRNYVNTSKDCIRDNMHAKYISNHLSVTQSGSCFVVDNRTIFQ